MGLLEKIIQPTIGIFSNIGSAHDEGFNNVEKKIEEKLKLFSNVNVLIYCHDHSAIHSAVKEKIKTLSWGEKGDVIVNKKGSAFYFQFREKSFTVSIPFSDKASIENAIHCIVLMLHLNYDSDLIQKRISELKSVGMRLQLKEGINQSQIIDDTYNNDLAGLQISLDFLGSHQKKKKTIILSDILQSGMNEEALAKNIAQLTSKNVQKLIGIGSILKSIKKLFTAIPSVQFFESTDEFLKAFDFDSIDNEVVLVKGARSFQFEKIIQRLQRKVHGTIMEIDLGKLVNNLNYFKSKLKPGVKIMAMVKAFAYGSGSEEVANLLQYHKVDYLGVAYTDEGMRTQEEKHFFADYGDELL
ncbi:MAG: alanine racemase [Cyclobacteriaceae bacterium]